MLAACLVLSLAGLVPTAQDEDRIQKLIQALSDPSKDERAKAVEDLAKIGRPALEALRKLGSSTDLEVKGMAAQAIEKIEWVGLDQLKAYVKDNLDEGSTLEASKLKGLAKWFPESRFYEVASTPVAGGQQAAMAAMGMPPQKSLFAICKYETGFFRLIVKGIYSSGSIGSFIQKAALKLPNDDAALDLAVAYMELLSSGSPQNASMWMMNGTSRLEKTPQGWALHAGMYGGQVFFRTDKDGLLLSIDQQGPMLNQGAHPGADKLAEERGRLEVEKLKLEVALLKRQLDKK